MSDVQEPSEVTKTSFTDKICDEVLIELDGWQIATKEDIESDDSEPFINVDDEKQLKNIGKNHKVSKEEVEYFYYKALNEALNDTNRSDITDLNNTLTNFFIDGVIKLTASNLWIKYNTSVTVNNEEGIIDYGQGGKLYKKYQKIIKNFVKSELLGLSSL